MFYNMLRKVSFVGKKRKSSTKIELKKRRCFSIVFDGYMQSTTTLP